MQKRFKKNIFGRCYEFSYPSNAELLMEGALSLYESTDERPAVLVVLKLNQGPSEELVSRNPRIHAKTKTGMSTSFGRHVVNWGAATNDILRIDFFYNKQLGLLSLVKKLISIEYATDIEMFLQVLHELVLVPSVYFFSDSFMPIHGAALKIDDRLVVLAGTGGVGKSSAMLALKEREDTAFISDDIVVVSNESLAFGNMAWPKIYGYNCDGNGFEKELLAGRSLLDKTLFHFFNSMDGTRVRRKISPDKLFNRVSSVGSEVTDILYLFREDVAEMKVSLLGLNDAVSLTIEVMLAEYAVFHNHLFWEKYNSIVTGLEPVLDMEEVKKNWLSVLKSGFSEANIFRISIPLDYSHDQYMSEIKLLFSKACFSDAISSR